MKLTARRNQCGFTLLEMMFATAISTVIAIVVLGSMVEGMHLFRSNSTEMVARDQGSIAIRKISTDVQNAAQVQIYSNYQSTSGTSVTYGSCAVLTDTGGGTVAYYLYASNASNSNTGGIYYSRNTGAINPATDKLLVSSVQDFEFRSDASGSIRTGFKIGIYGYPTLQTGSKEPDLVRFTTSNVPRNL